ncbi:MAG: Mu transposase C-terminal domain-containing protein [Methylovulum sp.]|nr:Mu transposase C-terminal domain-containing protein [Methylovulum sp.]
MVAEVKEVKDPVVKKCAGCTVEANYKLFFSEKLMAYEGQDLLVIWDETDLGEQVWVGDLEGNLIVIARWISHADYAKTQAYTARQVAYEAQLKKEGL